MHPPPALEFCRGKGLRETLRLAEIRGGNCGSGCTEGRTVSLVAVLGELAKGGSVLFSSPRHRWALDHAAR